MNKAAAVMLEYFNCLSHNYSSKSGCSGKINRMFIIAVLVTVIPIMFFFRPESNDGHALIDIHDSGIEEGRKSVRPLPQKVTFNEKKARLGKMLYSEKSLSPGGDVSCSTCHDLNSGGTSRYASGLNSELMDYKLNAPSIFNSAYNSLQFWNGRDHQDDELLSIEHRKDEKSKIKISEILLRLKKNGKYGDLFEEAYQDGMTGANIRDALREYLKILTTPNSRFDRYLRGEIELNEEEKEGYALFRESGCMNCHQGINLGGNMLHYLGVYRKYYADEKNASDEDYGAFNATGWDEDKYKFRVPSLRNVAVTGPYLHDGSIESLEMTVRIMAEYQLGTHLDSGEIRRMVIFLNTLTGSLNQKEL